MADILYSVDTSALIDLTRLYPRDVFPGIWEEVELLVASNLFAAPREVFRELTHKDDEIAKWAKSQTGMFRDMDSAQEAQVKIIVNKFPQMVDPQKTTPDADPMVIALAICEVGRVVTAERRHLSPKSIPFACAELKVPCTDLVGFFRERKLALHNQRPQ
ncbi:MAG: DUF4411 family protein [bacterium]|nr:DUF4411 family protein [bacterium]